MESNQREAKLKVSSCQPIRARTLLTLYCKVNSEVVERFETWGVGGGGGGGAHLSPSHAHIPTPKFSLRCSLAQANLFAIFTVSSVSVIDL